MLDGLLQDIARAVVLNAISIRSCDYSLNARAGSAIYKCCALAMLFINKRAEKRSSLEDMTSPTVQIMKCIHVGVFGATV